MSENENVRVVAANGDSRTVTVVMASAFREELTSPKARQKAIDVAAQKGLVRPGLSDFPRPYPVNDLGSCTQDVLMNPGNIKEYRCEYVINGMP